jgi:lysophospholipase L1-like esterase
MMNAERRDFIKKIGIAGAAAMSLPEILLAKESSARSVHDSDVGKGTVVLFQGDSITDGNRTRDNDWNHIMGHGYAYLIASRLWYDYPQQKQMFYNRGISGNRVSDLEARWQKDTLDLKPDVLSILIGVNDVMAVVKNQDPEPVEVFEATYKRILDKTKDSLPNTKLVLCEPFILSLGWVNENPEVWQAETAKRAQIVRMLAEQYDACFIELQNPFLEACKKAPAEYWIWDGVHPMPAGHEMIARLWIKKVKEYLKFIHEN